jgi:hypothetical protein
MAESIIAGRGTAGTVGTNLSGGSSGLGRDFLDVTFPVTDAKSLTRVEILLSSVASLVLKIKVFRSNGTSYDFIGGSQEFSDLTASSVNNLILSTPISVLVGDLVCVHADPVGSSNISVFSGGSTVYDSSGSDYEADVLQTAFNASLSFTLMYSAYGDDLATSITIATPTAQQRFKQRNTATNQHTFTIAGNISSLPAGAIVQYQLDGGTWQTLDSSPSTTYSGTVIVTSTQDIAVRLLDDVTPYSAGSITCAACAMILGDGQSNMAGRGFNNQALTLTGGITPLRYKSGVFSTASDPMGIDGSAAGTWQIKFLSLIASANPSITYCFINVAQGGTSINRWLKSASDLYPRLTAAVADTGGFEASLTLIGETDANNDMPEAEAITKYGQFINDKNADFGIDTFLINFPKLNYSGNDAIRAAFASLVLNNANCFDGGDLRPIDIANTGGDGIHLQTDSQLTEAGEITYEAFYLVTAISNLARLLSKQLSRALSRSLSNR